ncbi:MAG: ABC transporter ATP-binding protein [Patescibacteria group bacterium]|nr:ABC transporter ATP-binding protein [Patescibacteria group bacterium]
MAKEITKLSKTYFRTLRYSFREKRLFITTIILTITATAFKLAIPFLIGAYFDRAQKFFEFGNQFTHDLILISLAYFAVLFGDAITQSLSDYMIGKWWIVTQTKLFTELFKHVSTLSLSFFEKNPTGKIRERIWDGSMAIINILENTYIIILPHVFYFVSAIIILLFMRPIFAIIILVAAPIYFYVSYRFFVRLKKVQEVSRKRWEDLSTFVTESIFNARTMKTFATEKDHVAKTAKLTVKSSDSETEWQRIYAWSRSLRYNILNVIRVLTMGTAFYLIMHGQLTLGSLIVIWSYINGALDPINNMARSIDNIQKLLVSTSFTFTYLDTLPTVVDREDAKTLKTRSASISFKNISFRYKDKAVINNFSLDIPNDTVVAVVGKSGSGKTTLIKLLLRLYDVDKGEIKINNKNIKQFTQESLRKNIAVIMQDSALFNDTVKYNILYSSKKHDRKRMKDAARISNSEKFIEALPEKYDTLIGERGVKLSGGEQQRLGIARALYKDAPILIFDEATSSLDSENEKLIQDAIWKLIKGRTTIIIAHRLSTVMKADLIVVMDKGKISEVGTHKDLVKKKGIYSRLFEIQSGGYLT